MMPLSAHSFQSPSNPAYLFIEFVVFIELCPVKRIQLSTHPLFHQPNEHKKRNKLKEHYSPEPLNPLFG